jgi:hypothetical protein
MTDRTTKALLAALVLGMWANVALLVSYGNDTRRTLDSINGGVFLTNERLGKADGRLQDIFAETRAVVDELTRQRPKPSVPAWR